MKTIHRLVLKSYLGPMVLTFFIVMFVLMMNIVWLSLIHISEPTRRSYISYAVFCW